MPPRSPEEKQGKEARETKQASGLPETPKLTETNLSAPSTDPDFEAFRKKLRKLGARGDRDVFKD